jgi:hypothetical protein
VPFDKVLLKANGHTYIADRVVGSGSFGVVVRASIQETNDVVAIKKVLQDKRYKVCFLFSLFNFQESGTADYADAKSP